MANSIVGTLPIKHSVDANGSLSITVPLQPPPAKMAPDIALAYHSASNNASSVGVGWTLKGVSIIERVAATKVQDGRRGIVNFDNQDCFALNGQRLVRIGTTNEYRYEVEQWSKIVAEGPEANPTYWTEYLPNGTSRTFGKIASSNSNIKAVGRTGTRAWAIDESIDPFKNYVSYTYASDATTGAFWLTSVKYGGNTDLSMAHQRELTFSYDNRKDVRVRYHGGSKVTTDKILKSIAHKVNTRTVRTHRITHDEAPLTGATRVSSITLEDADGKSTVRPLKFDWHDANPRIFEAPTSPTRLDPKDHDAFIMPIDVYASGKSDLVVVSKRLKGGVQKLHLDVHQTDGNGGVPATPTTQFDGDLAWSDKLFPLDFNGDGRNDILHVTTSAVQRTHTLTVLLSTPDGYKAQPSMTFNTDFTGGHFYTGDFEGNGNIGLVYVSQRLVSGSPQLRFTQFVADGGRFKPLDTIDGPTGVNAADARIVVGDLNGDGAEDVFIISSTLKSGSSVCRISFLESKDGRLTYKANPEFASAAESIFWSTKNVFLPYSADEDGKTSLLAATATRDNKLQLQVLRSTGPTLLPPAPPIATGINYNGNITLARASSTTSVDLVNTFNRTVGTAETQLTVMRFFGDSFETVQDVTQPKALSSFVTYADLRGVGRVDCLLNTREAGSGVLNVAPMKSSASLQPVDFITGYENGLGAKLSVAYAPLSDRSTYTVDASAPEGANPDSTASPLPAVNALSRNMTSSAAISTSGATPEVSARTRSQIAYFPSYVVKTVKHAPYAAKPDVVDHHEYTYKNARYGFEGRGWLGFEKVTKTVVAEAAATTTLYRQDHPFVGQVAEVAVEDTKGETLKVTKNTWECTEGPGKSRFLHLSAVQENHFEDGKAAFNVDVSYQHDNFGNISNITIKNSQPGTTPLSIDAEYENDEQNWVLGNKTVEKVQQNGKIVKHSTLKYHPKSAQVSEARKWVGPGDTWSVQTVEFDKAGNDSIVTGPGKALMKLTYDETYSNVKTSSTYVADGADPLVETVEFDLASGKPATATEPNGNTTTLVYDVLGRVIQTSIGGKVVEKQAFETDGTHFYQIAYDDFGGDDVQFKTINHIDGLSRVWRTETPRPDKEDEMVYSDVEFDGSGRTVARSRDYLASTTPVYTKFKYDARSRVIEQTVPAAAADVSSLTVTTKYSFADGVAKITETKSKGDTDTAVNIREVVYHPNNEPSADKFVLPYVTAATDELQQTIRTVFDALGQPSSIEDPSGAKLSLSWDGLGRVVSRRVSHTVNGSSKDINYTTALYEDDDSKLTIENKLTSVKTITKMDWAQRPITKETPDETLTFTYDKGGDNTKERLASVSSSKNIKHTFGYDVRGNVTTATLNLDGKDYTTKYTWTLANELLSTTNPDGSVVKRSLLADGQSVGKIELLDAAQATRAWVNLKDYSNGNSRPLGCDFGNGLGATSALADNGTIASIELAKGKDIVHKQNWKIDAFSRITNYDLAASSLTSAGSGNAFHYDAAGQLKKRETQDSSNPDEFTYDQGGNLKTKNGKTFVNDGWQLSQIKGNDDRVEFSFKYSDDGHLISKHNESGGQTSTMDYDADGRLIKMDGTEFVYDFSGQLLKAKLADGSVRIYVNQSHEVDIPQSGSPTHTTYLVHGYRRAALAKTEGSSSDTIHYFHTDHLGSIVAVSDESGAVISEYAYDSFGKFTVTAGKDISRYKFSGKEAFGALYYFGARFYDPDLGRFLTLDNYPISIEGIKTSTFNMYTFSRNDPVNYIDLNGNVPWWHWLVDIALIAVGVALMFVPGVNAIVLGAITGALIGAGIAGATYDIKAQISGQSDNKAWGMQIGLGALFGAISGGASAYVNTLLPAVTIVDVLSSQGALGLKVVGGFVLRTTVRIGINSAMSSGLGVVQQVVENAINGEPLDKGLLEAAWTSALTGAASGAKNEAIAFLKPLKGQGIRLKFWKNRNWRVYRVAHTEKLSQLGKMNKNVEYPLRQTYTDVTHVSGVATWKLPSGAPQLISYRHLPIDEITSL
ncbi:hypothetical protein HGRIS_000054 [Hohenbuehelia grisea]|uniref:Teneurin-like YD-shell domain-containing protein n=1 Tax=Hohenbuehelia grisea TaxID=104357 RepID=A0ABR3JQ32_9AGAR